MKVPRPIFSPGQPRQSPGGELGWVSRHPHGAGVVSTAFPYCKVMRHDGVKTEDDDGAVDFVDLAILLERSMGRDASSPLDYRARTIRNSSTVASLTGSHADGVRACRAHRRASRARISRGSKAFTSATIPRSETEKIAASGSLLIAMM